MTNTHGLNYIAWQCRVPVNSEVDYNDHIDEVDRQLLTITNSCKHIRGLCGCETA